VRHVAPDRTRMQRARRRL